MIHGHNGRQRRGGILLFCMIPPRPGTGGTFVFPYYSSIQMARTLPVCRERQDAVLSLCPNNWGLLGAHHINKLSLIFRTERYLVLKFILGTPCGLDRGDVHTLRISSRPTAKLFRVENVHVRAYGCRIGASGNTRILVALIAAGNVTLDPARTLSCTVRPIPSRSLPYK